MKDKRKTGATDKADRTLAALRDFFSGYLHQDFREEYGSAAAAAAAFCSDAEPADLAVVRREWTAWRTRLREAGPDTAAVEIRKLGGAWQPQTLAELDAVERALDGKES